jgi:hypothetical protein
MCKPAIALNVIAGAKTINTDDNTAINAFEMLCGLLQYYTKIYN